MLKINKVLHRKKEKNFLLLDLVLAMFVTVLIPENRSSAKRSRWGCFAVGVSLAFDGGTCFPISYIVGDV